MENQIYIYGRDTTTGLIQPLNYTGQGQNVIINTSSSSGAFEIADATDFNDYIEGNVVMVNDGAKTLSEGLTEAGARQGIVIKMSAGSFGDATPISIDKINVAIEGEVYGKFAPLTEIFAPLTLSASSQRIRLSGLQLDGGLTINAAGAVIVNHNIYSCTLDGLSLAGAKASGSTAFVRFMDCDINDVVIAAGYNITTYFIRCTFSGTFTNANTTQGVIVCVDCVGLPDGNGGTGAVINRASWAQSGTTQKVSAHLGYSSLGVIYSDYSSPLLNSTLKWRDEKTALMGGTDKTIALVENLATVATSGAYSDLSGKPTLATVATSGSYVDLTNKPTLVDELDELIDVAITPASLTNSSYLGYNTALSLWENKTLPTLATVATTGSYLDLSSRPTLATVATSGLYSDLSGTPTLATVATSGSYNDLINKPVLATVASTGLYSDLSGTPTLATVASTGSYADLSDKPTIPATLDDLTDVVISAPSGNQGVIYNSTTNRFENRRPVMTDNSDLAFTGLLNGDILTYSSSLSRWYNRAPSTPHFLSYIWPNASQNLGVVSTGDKSNFTIDFTETLNDFTGLACNTFLITGLTNALYRMKFVMGFRRTTAADVSFFIELREGSNSSASSNPRVALAQESCYIANATGCCVIECIRDYRTTLPAYTHISYQNQTADAAQVVIQSCFIVVERIYNTPIA